MKNILFESRDHILGWFFGVKGKPILNEGECEERDTQKIPQEIAESVLDLKKSAIINDSGVDYAKLMESEEYVRFREKISSSLKKLDLKGLYTREEKLAFWINLYNLLTIDAVLQYGVNKSVTEGWFGAIRFFRRAAYMVGGYRFSLEDIEHGVLRANRGVPFFPGTQFAENDPRFVFTMEEFDARIHFALNRASKSCPPIAYYTSTHIDDQLDLATANFIGGETTLEKSGVVLIISRIFKWYARDFGGWVDILAIIKKYLPEHDMRRKLIENFGKDVMVQYAPYDWHLNVIE
jgi:hypothetical protein